MARGRKVSGVSHSIYFEFESERHGADHAAEGGREREREKGRTASADRVFGHFRASIRGRQAVRPCFQLTHSRNDKLRNEFYG